MNVTDAHSTRIPSCGAAMDLRKGESSRRESRNVRKVTRKVPQTAPGVLSGPGEMDMDDALSRKSSKEPVGPIDRNDGSWGMRVAGIIDKGRRHAGEAASNETAGSSGRKRQRGSRRDADCATMPGTLADVSLKQHPFETEYGDHFETPMQAYRDVELVLALLAKALGKKRKHLRIWDPYYCAGRTSRFLAQLGFHKVEHRNEDFYKIVEDLAEPRHDVIVTNPPYSGDHKQRCLEYCRASGKPWLLLIPNYVATKDYYRLTVLGKAAGPGGEPFYVVPHTKYHFDHPEGTGHADSPFSGVWFVYGGPHTDALYAETKAGAVGNISVLRSLGELGRTGAVKTERRLNPRQRKALKRKRGVEASRK